MALSPEERASLPANMQVPQKEPRKVVEHTPESSFADMSDLAARVPLSYRPNLQMHGVKQHIDCEATASADGHSGAATHLIRMPGERSDQVEAVCALHHTRLMSSALEKGGYDVASRRITPSDVEPHNFHRAQQTRLVRTAVERDLYKKGMTGENLLVGRSTEELGKGGGKRTTHAEEVELRRTPAQRATALDMALEKVKVHGGRTPPASSAPTVDFDGEAVPLGESYARLASLRRKSEPDIDPKRPGNTENYYMAGIKSPDGSTETEPRSTRRFNLNKAGVPNPKGGRKSRPAVEPFAKDDSDVVPPSKGFLPGKVQRKAVKVTLDQLPITAYPTETPGAPDDAETIRISRKSQKRSTDRAVDTLALNTEADRLRGIEAKKTKMAEGRNKAFKVDWNDVPRPE
jgi:hypothetical protein